MGLPGLTRLQVASRRAAGGGRVRRLRSSKMLSSPDGVAGRAVASSTPYRRDRGLGATCRWRPVPRHQSLEDVFASIAALACARVGIDVAVGRLRQRGRGRASQAVPRPCRLDAPSRCRWTRHHLSLLELGNGARGRTVGEVLSWPWPRAGSLRLNAQRRSGATASRAVRGPEIEELTHRGDDGGVIKGVRWSVDGGRSARRVCGCRRGM